MADISFRIEHVLSEENKRTESSVSFGIVIVVWPIVPGENMAFGVWCGRLGYSRYKSLDDVEEMSKTLQSDLYDSGKSNQR
jgi:hypothetical protein